MGNELMGSKDMNRTSASWDRIHTGNFVLQVQLLLSCKELQLLSSCKEWGGRKQGHRNSACGE